MQCPICKHGTTHSGVTNVSLERDGAVFVLKHVHADICDNCGEEFVTAETATSVLLQASKAVGNGVQVDIREYLAA